MFKVAVKTRYGRDMRYFVVHTAPVSYFPFPSVSFSADLKLSPVGS